MSEGKDFNKSCMEILLLACLMLSFLFFLRFWAKE
uniref:Uncharacterized protein n=1 Tax=Amphimedon queenslandica TaxID=400682 RepID=A0A1X7TXH0_AMPQE